MTGFADGPLSALLDGGRDWDVVADWSPFPVISDRAAWDAISQPLREHARDRASTAATAAWPALPASLWADYHRTGNRARFEAPYFDRRSQVSDLVCGAGVSGAVADPLLDRLWSVCEESTWCFPAHDRKLLPDPAHPVPDLFAAQTASQLALARHVLKPALDELSPVIADRIAAEIDHRVITGYLTSDDWWWFGQRRTKVNNWNPWINLNVLVSGLLVIVDPQRRAALVRRVGHSLDAYLACMPNDGGCTEGQTYWALAAAKVLDAVTVIRDATGGRIDGTGLPQLTAAARYPVAMHIAENLMVQHADGPGRFDQEPQLLHRYGHTVGDAELQQLAVHLRDRQHLYGGQGSAAGVPNLWDQLHRTFDDAYQAAPAGGPAPYPALSWFATTEVLSVRERAGTADGLFLVVKGGHNDEEHNHNDVGSFSIALDGQPLVVDAGVNTYSSETFGPNRYDIWTMQSGWHNLPTVNGHQQLPGADHRATEVRTAGLDDPAAGQVAFSAEIAGAWSSEARIRSWRRRVLLDRIHGAVELTDTWDVCELESLTLGLVTPLAPHFTDGKVRIGDLLVTHPGLTAAVEQQEIPAGDRLESTWGRRLWRIVLTPESLCPQGSWTLRFGPG